MLAAVKLGIAPIVNARSCAPATRQRRRQSHMLQCRYKVVSRPDPCRWARQSRRFSPNIYSIISIANAVFRPFRGCVCNAVMGHLFPLCLAPVAHMQQNALHCGIRLSELRQETNIKAHRDIRISCRPPALCYRPILTRQNALGTDLFADD